LWSCSSSVVCGRGGVGDARGASCRRRVSTSAGVLPVLQNQLLLLLLHAGDLSPPPPLPPPPPPPLRLLLALLLHRIPPQVKYRLVEGASCTTTPPGHEWTAEAAGQRPEWAASRAAELEAERLRELQLEQLDQARRAQERQGQEHSSRLGGRRVNRP
jgi:hypothetical protein